MPTVHNVIGAYLAECRGMFSRKYVIADHVTCLSTTSAQRHICSQGGKEPTCSAGSCPRRDYVFSRAVSVAESLPQFDVVVSAGVFGFRSVSRGVRSPLLKL